MADVKDYRPIKTLDWAIGYHCMFNKQVCPTIQQCVDSGVMATQFFLGNPHSYNRTKISDQDIRETCTVLNHFPMHVFTHFPYISNLAGSTSCLAWTGNAQQDHTTQTVLQSLTYELGIVAQLRCNRFRSGVVIHPGSYAERDEGLKTIVSSINRITFPPNSTLILENSAGQGTTLATTLEEIRTIINGVQKPNRQHLGVCIDTCHTFAYGDYDISTVKGVDQLFTDVDRVIGKEYLTVVHLNDSQHKKGSRKDRHACLGQGCIWQEDYSSLVRLLDRLKQYDVPVILETPNQRMDMATLCELSSS